LFHHSNHLLGGPSKLYFPSNFPGAASRLPKRGGVAPAVTCDIRQCTSDTTNEVAARRLSKKKDVASSTACDCHLRFSAIVCQHVQDNLLKKGYG
jgi:hypothetical protein